MLCSVCQHRLANCRECLITVYGRALCCRHRVPEEKEVASSTCIKCGNRIFELVEQEPINAAFRLNFVQCSSCGGVVGVLDHFNIAQLISEFAKKLGARANRIVSGNLTTDDAEGA